MLKIKYEEKTNNNVFRRHVNIIKKTEDTEQLNEENARMVEELEKTVKLFADSNGITLRQAIDILGYYKST